MFLPEGEVERLYAHDPRPSSAVRGKARLLVGACDDLGVSSSNVKTNTQQMMFISASLRLASCILAGISRGSVPRTQSIAELASFM